MLDTDTFLIGLYMLADDFCKTAGTGPTSVGRPAQLAPSEVLTLALFSQWARFDGERDFYRFADRHLRPLFPRLPHRSQFNRQVRRCQDLLAGFFIWLSRSLVSADCPLEVIDTTPAVTRNCKRPGTGWLPEQTALGMSKRLGWYHGLRVLASVTPDGVLTGLGVAPANTSDQDLAECFLALRHTPDRRLPSVGVAAGGHLYLADKGFDGRTRHRRWWQAYQARVVCARQRGQGSELPSMWGRWLASLRQIVETFNSALQHRFRLDRERPHHLSGFLARLYAKAGLYNACISLNRQLGRPSLAFADLWAW